MDQYAENFIINIEVMDGMLFQNIKGLFLWMMRKLNLLKVF